MGDDDTVVVAFPFRHRGTAETFGAAVARAFGAITQDGVDPVVALGEIPAALAGHDPGETVRPLRPPIPVVAVTGTNGKTTTTRLIAHLVRAGGRTPGWSSTDGIVIDGRVVETGDWSGPGGAARVLEDPSVQVAVTETARGGILLRGVGTASNDVSVVTNISADHLGLLGVHTVEQLAEVKSVIVRITKPNGWAVLNADDPLVRAMRMVSRARPWFYSPDPENPYLEEALDAGGRAITVVDGQVVVLGRGLDPVQVIAVPEVPLTLAGASRVNVSNVLAATAAAIGMACRWMRSERDCAPSDPTPSTTPAGSTSTRSTASPSSSTSRTTRRRWSRCWRWPSRCASPTAGSPSCSARPATGPTRPSTRWARWPRPPPTASSWPAG